MFATFYSNNFNLQLIIKKNINVHIFVYFFIVFITKQYDKNKYIRLNRLLWN